MLGDEKPIFLLIYSLDISVLLLVDKKCFVERKKRRGEQGGESCTISVVASLRQSKRVPVDGRQNSPSASESISFHRRTLMTKKEEFN